MDKKLIISEMKRVFLADDELANIITYSNESLFFDFQQKTFALWGLDTTDSELVRRKRSFVIHATKEYIESNENTDTRLLEVNTLLDVSNSINQFNELFTKKYDYKPSSLTKYTKEDAYNQLSDFDRKLMTALNFNWKKEKR